MSFEVPTTSEVSAVIIANLESSLSQTIPLLPKAFLRVLAKVLGGVYVILYKYIGFIFLQMFVQFASNEPTTINGKTFTPLVEYGRLFGAGDPLDGERAEYEIDITVENVDSSTLDSGTQLLNAGNGVTYLTIADVVLSSATVQADIRASQDPDNGGGIGEVGNLAIGDIVSFANPPAQVAGDAVTTVENNLGVDPEATEVYRSRVIDRVQKQPQGGAYADYEQWGEEANDDGIINVYPYTGNPGIVNVYSEATVASAGNDDGIPTTAQLQSVLDLINYNVSGIATRRPANALVYSLPITRKGFDVTVYGLADVANTDQAETAIESALESYFWGREPFIDGLSILPRLDGVTATAVGAAVDDVVQALGGVFTSVVVEYSGQNVQIYSLAEGEKSKLKSVSFP